MPHSFGLVPNRSKELRKLLPYWTSAGKTRTRSLRITRQLISPLSTDLTITKITARDRPLPKGNKVNSVFRQTPEILQLCILAVGVQEIVLRGHSVFRRSIIRGVIRLPECGWSQVNQSLTLFCITVTSRCWFRSHKWTQVLHIAQDSINLYWLQTVNLGYAAHPKLGRTQPL